MSSDFHRQQLEFLELGIWEDLDDQLVVDHQEIKNGVVKNMITPHSRVVMVEMLKLSKVLTSSYKVVQIEFSIRVRRNLTKFQRGTSTSERRQSAAHAVIIQQKSNIPDLQLLSTPYGADTKLVNVGKIGIETEDLQKKNSGFNCNNIKQLYARSEKSDAPATKLVSANLGKNDDQS